MSVDFCEVKQVHLGSDLCAAGQYVGWSCSTSLWSWPVSQSRHHRPKSHCNWSLLVSHTTLRASASGGCRKQ